MFDWWDILSSSLGPRLAQILSVVFLVLSVSSFFLTLKTSSRIAFLKGHGPEAWRPGAGTARPPVQAPPPSHSAAAKPARSPCRPVAAKPAPAALPPGASQAAADSDTASTTCRRPQVAAGHAPAGAPKGQGEHHQHQGCCECPGLCR